MNEQDLKELLAAIKRVNTANTATPETARNFLRQEGLLTDEGKLTEPYRRKAEKPAA